jgi:nucleoside-diphosphate-sugar epimerase
MKVLVIGGSGFIGSRLVKVLCKAGHQVRILSRKTHVPIAKTNASIEIMQCDLLDANFKLEKVVAGCSVVFNCAGELSNEDLMHQLHVDATYRLICASKRVAEATRHPLHWVQLSSVGAYGPVDGSANGERTVTEETTLSPVGVYEKTKAIADEMIVSAGEEGVFSFSILRPSNVYGAGMPNNSIRQWGRMIEKKLFFYVGSISAIATYIHVDDVIEALMLCGFDKRAKGEIFNISNDCTQECLVIAIAKALNVSPPRIRVPEGIMRFVAAIFSNIKEFPVSHSRIDALVARTSYPTNKLKIVLEYQPTRDVKETIAEVLLDDIIC